MEGPTVLNRLRTAEGFYEELYFMSDILLCPLPKFQISKFEEEKVFTFGRSGQNCCFYYLSLQFFLTASQDDFQI